MVDFYHEVHFDLYLYDVFQRGGGTIFKGRFPVLFGCFFSFQEFDTFEGCGALPLFFIISCVPPL